MTYQPATFEPQFPSEKSTPGPTTDPARSGQAGVLERSLLAFQAALDLQWGRLEDLHLLAQANELAVNGSSAAIMRGLTEALLAMTQGVALQIRDGNPQRFERAARQYGRTQVLLQQLKEEFPEVTTEKGFAALVNGMELQADWAAQRAAPPDSPAGQD
jgi:hypothetical protein